MVDPATVNEDAEHTEAREGFDSDYHVSCSSTVSSILATVYELLQH